MAAKPIRKVGSNTASNTNKKRGNGKPFAKNDPRINRLGRPRSFDALRELAQQIADEAAVDVKSGGPLVIAGHVATTAEMILRSWAHSNNPQLVKGFIEVAYGKVPDELKLTMSKVTLVWRDGNSDAAPTSGASASQEQSSTLSSPGGGPQMGQE